jgi:hypothetical protein
MEPVETIQITPSVRVQIYPDNDCSNPLDDWDHGIEFITLPDPSREWRDYKEPTSNTYGDVPAFELDDVYRFREFFGQDGYGQDGNEQNAPSLATLLDTHTAAWGTLDRHGYDGTLSLNMNPDDITDHDAIALVSREMFRSWHGIPDGKPMPRGYRTDAAKQLQGVIDEYNRWATGDCYGYQVQTHNPLCIDCMDPDDADPDPDCDGWTDTDDSYWGFIGWEHAEQEATEAGMNEAGIPIAIAS